VDGTFGSTFQFKQLPQVNGSVKQWPNIMIAQFRQIFLFVCQPRNSTWVSSLFSYTIFDGCWRMKNQPGKPPWHAFSNNNTDLFNRKN
jgi:hypothetical protein